MTTNMANMGGIWEMEDRKVFLNNHTNLLELEEHMYPLVDCGDAEYLPESVPV